MEMPVPWKTEADPLADDEFPFPAPAPPEPTYIGLYDTFAYEWVKLPVQAMIDCGAAAQTLGTLLRITKRETYRSVKNIADYFGRNLGLPLPTVRKHLKQLDKAGYIKNIGREGKRRTATIRILQQSRTAAEKKFGVLPWWATGPVNGAVMPWGSRAVLSVVLARLHGHRKRIEDSGWDLRDGEDLVEAVEEFGGDSGYGFPIKEIHEQTGLQSQAIVQAKRWLRERGIIESYSTEKTGRHGGDGMDSLYPSPEFRVVLSPNQGVFFA